MKIAIVLAPFLFKRCPLIGLAYLSAYLKKDDFELLVFDLNSEIEPAGCLSEAAWDDEAFVDGFISANRKILIDYVDRILQSGAEVIGFSIWKTTRRLSLVLAEMIKEQAPARLIVFGGPECSFSGAEIISKKYVDAVVYGEGEATFLQIAQAHRQKKQVDLCPGAFLKNSNGIIDCGFREEIKDLDSLPFPDYSGFRQEIYDSFSKISIMFNRGCWGRCVFCNTSVSWKKYRSRSAENIYREMEYQLDRYPAIKRFEVDDSALNLNLKQLSKLCDLLINGKISVDWGGSAMLHPEMDGRLLAKMAHAGCTSLAYGLESGSQDVVAAMKKGFTINDADRLVKETRLAGIEVIVNIVIGFPNETERDFFQTMEFVERNKKYISSIAYPSECAIVNSSYMHRYPDEFGVCYPDNGHWESLGGINTHEERQRRIRVFEGFIDSLGISMPRGKIYA